MHIYEFAILLSLGDQLTNVFHSLYVRH